MPPITATARPEVAAEPGPSTPRRVSHKPAAALWGLAALAVAIARALEPFEHGWWLVAFFGLVGALSQLLLVSGREALAQRRWRATVGELVLWNAGTALVPLGVLLDISWLVAAGSVALLSALAAFAATTARVSRGHRRWAVLAYRALMLGLTASVFVGAGLAEALPWQ
jgi:hypothetical protein